MLASEFPWRKKFNCYAVGLVSSTEAFGKGPNKYTLCVVDVGTGVDTAIHLVTSDNKVAQGDRVVVAKNGAIVPAGADPEDEGAFVVQKTTVGGRASHGVLCDSVALGWLGGAKGVAIRLGEEFALGSLPPATKPRK